MKVGLKTLAVVVVTGLAAHGVAKHGGAVATSLGARMLSAPSASTLPPAPTSTGAPPPVDEEAWTGVLLAQAVDLTARIETKVKILNFRVGDQVRAGDALAELDTSAQQHEKTGAEAALRASRAEAWNASISVSQARERQTRRSKVAGALSGEELSDSKFDSLAASSRASAAGAMADERGARLAHLNQIMQEATLRAPFDGVVATRYVELGAHVRPGMPVVRVVGRGNLRVRFAVPESEVDGLPLRSRVVLEWDDKTLHAVIDRRAPEVDSTTSCVFMEAEVETAQRHGNDHGALAGRVVGVRRARTRPQG